MHARTLSTCLASSLTTQYLHNPWSFLFTKLSKTGIIRTNKISVQLFHFKNEINTYIKKYRRT